MLILCFVLGWSDLHFLRFSKIETLLTIRYSLRITIFKKSANLDAGQKFQFQKMKGTLAWTFLCSKTFLLLVRKIDKKKFEKNTNLLIFSIKKIKEDLTIYRLNNLAQHGKCPIFFLSQKSLHPTVQFTPTPVNSNSPKCTIVGAKWQLCLYKRWGGGGQVLTWTTGHCAMFTQYHLLLRLSKCPFSSTLTKKCTIFH